MKLRLFPIIHYFILTALIFSFWGCGRPPRPVRERPPEPLALDVVYPRPAEGDTIFVVPRVDSTFALGSVWPVSAAVFVNGLPARVWENGAFLAYFPLDTAALQYDFLAVSSDGDSLRISVPFVLEDQLAAEEEKIELPPIDRHLPVRITISWDGVVLRTEPQQAYWLFPLAGSEALADSFVFPYYRIRLGEGLHAWVEDRFVVLDTCRHDPPRSVVNTIAVKGQYPWTEVRIPLQEPLLFRFEERPELGLLALELFGAVARMDQIGYDPADSLVCEIRWNQLRDDLLRLEIVLNSTRLWGYSAKMEDDDLVVRLRWPPRIQRRPLEGRTIVLDAGHGGTEFGAIGPTRLAEKEVNLKLAFKLKELLEKEGARVLLTRWSDSTLGIYDRIDYAVEQGAEILLSLHNNALPDGKNPFEQRGSSVYYYHPQSRDLAWMLHQRLLEATGLQDHGFYFKNLAMARPSEMLAVLLECTFIIHPEEETLLREQRFIDRISRSLVKGLKDYLRPPRRRTRYEEWSERYRFGGVIRPPWYRIEPVRQFE